MASVDALLTALHYRTREITDQPPSQRDSSMLGWNRLARNAMRVLVMVDPPPELMPVLRRIVDLADRRDPAKDALITSLGRTMGALADTIVARPEVVAAASRVDRLQLRSSVLSALHTAAAATVSAMPSATSRDLEGCVREVSDATEAASYVPWRSLHAPLGLLALGPKPGGIEKAVANWAESAIDILKSPTRVTGYALQRTAASIAQLCLAAGAVFVPTGESGAIEEEVEVSLARAMQSWHVAAGWPPEVLLGGRTPELRHRSQELESSIAEDRIHETARPTQELAMQAALVVAGDVGIQHESALTRLVDTRGLWIAARALGPAYLTRHPGVRRNDWILDPGSDYGTRMLDAVHRANMELWEASRRIDQLQRTRQARHTQPMLWEKVVAREQTREGMRNDRPPTALSIGM